MQNGSGIGRQARNGQGRTTVDHFRGVLLAHPDRCTYRYLEGGEGEPVTLANAELDRRARAIAVALRERVSAGDRALIVSPPGLDYIAAFFGCLYSGVIAVPVYPPEPAHLKRTLGRLLGVVDDAQPAIILAPADVVAMADQVAAYAPALAGLPWLAVDAVPAAADHWQHPATEPDGVAFLQYTSGSTSRPKGVMVTHANLLHNLAVINEQFLGPEQDPGRNLVTWLPPYHDMGLIGGLLQPAFASFPVTVMSPLAFLKRPERWLRTISRYRATVSGGPNFAYDLCVEKIRPEHCAGLDLSSWRLAFNGAEPIRAQTIARFSAAFEPYGFRRDAFYPCYGLAEGTLLSAGADRARGPVLRTFDVGALARNSGRDAAPGPEATTLVSSGSGVPGQRLIVVDPERLAGVEDGTVGEIWLSGPSVAAGYWQAPAESEAVFGARLAGEDGTRYLRTGDLGFLSDGELFVTGRRKDLIIVAGRNHYPQDIERSVEGSHPALRPGCGVACSVSVDDEERLLIVYEVIGRPGPAEVDEIFTAIRRTVAQEHNLLAQEIVLVPRGAVPKTSSGKLQRSACRSAFLRGALGRLASWSSSAPVGAPAGAPDEPAAEPTATAPQLPGGRQLPGAPQLPGGPQLQHWLREQVARRTHLPVNALDARQPFVSFGLGSVDMLGVVGDLERWLGQPLSTTLLWEYPTIESLAAHLGSRPADGAAAASSAASSAAAGLGRATSGDGTLAEPVAIIGIGCRFPGGGDSPGSFWKLLSEGRDAITAVPADRWAADDFFDEDPATPGKATTRWGGFLDRVDTFDPQFFGISPREAAQMDPQQRLLAEVAWEAIEDAGLVSQRLAGSPTGVFVGIATSDYAHLTLGDPTRIDAFTGTGNAFSIAANRLSYLFDLRGPSLAIDTACSSSLVAVYQACQSLAQGDCSVALAGGVNVILSPALAINFSKAGAMAPDGRCKAFDARADGYVRGEGAGVVVLKPLSKALADGDRIYATIRGGAINQDGRTNGLMAPNPHAQEAVLRAAYAHAGVAPHLASYVEAHGTGTLLGDPIEVKALGAVLGADRDRSQPLLIGSVKSNIGHLEAAAGIAGLIKTALVLHHRYIPASLHYRQANPHIPFGTLPLRVADSALPWPGRDAPALAGVSSFGFGGTNAHLVLQEPPAPDRDGPAPAPRPHLLTLSARGEQSLRDLASRYLDHLGPEADPVRVGEVCRAAALRRTHHERRLVCIGDSAEQLREQLAAFADAGQRPVPYRPGGQVGFSPDVAFVFSGQGPRWWPLSSELIATEPVFRTVLERCEAWLSRQVDWSLLDQLGADPATTLLGDPMVGQPALCSVQVALAALWRSWGVEPTVVVGHSAGEIAAACVAGALELEDALRVALRRGQAIRKAVGLGRMAVVGLPFDQAKQALAGLDAEAVWVSASNGPTSTVLSGETGALEHVAGTLRAQGVFCRLLETVPFASHCPQMDPLLDGFRGALAGLTPRPTSLPMLSTVTARLIEGTSLDAGYWAANLREPVLFDQAVTALVDAGQHTFVEISAHPMLGTAIDERLDLNQRPGVVVGSLDRDEPGPRAFLGALAQLYCAGFGVDWQRRYGPDSRMVDLPAYPWHRQRCWMEDGPARRATPTGSGHPMLETPVRSAVEPRAAHWTGWVDTEQYPYLADHCVAGTAVLPASSILDLATAAARQLLGEPDVALTGVAFTRIIAVEAHADQENLQLVLLPENAAEGSFQLFTRAGADAEWAEAAHGRFQAGGDLADAPALPRARDRCTELVDGAEHYARLRAAGLQYGAAFQGVGRLWRGHREAVAELRPPTAVRADRDRYLVHPALLDSCLQVLAEALTAEPGDATYLPVEVERFTLRGEQVVPCWARAAVSADPADADIAGAQVTLFDRDGAPIGQLDGIRLRRLEAGAGADEAPDPLLDLDWHEVVARPLGAEHPGAGEPPAGTGWWLLLADRGGLCEQVRQGLAGHTVVTVTAGDGFGRVDETHYTVDPSRPRDVVALLSELSAQLPAPCLGVVHAWSLDAEPPADDTGSALLAAAELNCVSVLHVVQALTRVGWDPRPRLVLLTQGAQRIAGEGVAPAVAQAALWGLARVILLEHGELRPTIIDLDPAGGTGARDLCAELLAGRGEQQLALREGTWYAPHLRPWRTSDSAEQWQRRDFDPARDANHRILAVRPGTLDSLAPTLWRRGQPGPDEVEIEVGAAGLNFNDVLKAMDICPGVPPGRVPLGAECAGRVVAVGDGVTRCRVGDAVIAVAPSSLAAFTTTAAQLVAPLPDGLTAGQGAAIPIAFLTALYGLEYLAHLGPGESVLIHSATGGVGMAALQIASRNGARIFATAGTEHKRDLLRAMGVEHVMDSRSLRFADEVMELTKGRGVDVVLNSLAGQALTRSLSLLAANGRFVEIGKRDVYDNSHLGLGALRHNRSFFAVDLESTLAGRPDLIATLFDQVGHGFRTGELRALPVTEFGYTAATEAFTRLARARHTGKIVLRPDGQERIAVPPDEPAVRPDATYLITGGLGDLGRHTARYLVDRGARHLVLAGRRGPSEQAAAELAQLRSQGAQVEVRSVDVSQSAEVDAVLADIDATMPPLAGVVHAAGALDDGLLLQLDRERFDAVWDAKAAGAWHLHRATLGRSLDFFVLFSSAAALLGSPSQGNYAAANAFLDALAQYRCQQGQPALSISWGPWSRIGLAARADRDTALSDHGITSLSPQAGTEVLDRVLRASGQVCVLPVDPDKLTAAARSGLLPRLLADLPILGQPADGGPGAADIKARMLAVEPGRRRRAILTEHCAGEAARVLRLDPAQVEGTAPLAGLGFDSLMSLELRRRLETTLGVTLPATLAWRFPTIEALVPFLAERMSIALDPVPADPPARGDQQAAPGAADSPTALDGMSASDLESLLLTKISQVSEPDRELNR